MSRYTVCFKPGCGNVVAIGGCWCWEHLEVCHEAEIECEHPAHLCGAPVHFCELH